VARGGEIVRSTPVLDAKAAAKSTGNGWRSPWVASRQTPGLHCLPADRRAPRPVRLPLLVLRDEAFLAHHPRAIAQLDVHARGCAPDLHDLLSAVPTDDAAGDLVATSHVHKPRRRAARCLPIAHDVQGKRRCLPIVPPKLHDQLVVTSDLCTQNRRRSGHRRRRVMTPPRPRRQRNEDTEPRQPGHPPDTTRALPLSGRDPAPTVPFGGTVSSPFPR
jgi:hypothetical protein